jgi:trans-2,3-dihydro-3-hydroxyanthranilate isomerase
MDQDMGKHLFYIADVFAEKKYSGNQLGIVRNASDLSGEEMLEITREMNYSETTFILGDELVDGGYDVRIFTPGGEVPFAGHPTLGTAALIRREICEGNPSSITLNLKAGKIPVTAENDIFWMKQIPPVFGDTFSPENVAPIINVEPGQIDADYPVQWVSTGLPTLIVPLVSLDVVKQVKINRELYDPFIEKNGNMLILTFSRETLFPENQLHVRVLAPYLGVEEDPATGSANGCLTAYLAEHSFLGSDHFEEVRVEQGYQVNRPSLLLLSGKKESDQISVMVGGKVIFTAKGELF